METTTIMKLEITFIEKGDSKWDARDIKGIKKSVQDALDADDVNVLSAKQFLIGEDA